MTKFRLDKTVLLALSQGSANAFEVVFKTYSKLLFNRLIYILKDADEAEEILQNVFLKLWEKRDSIIVDKDLYPFLLKIAHSMAIDYLRKNIRTQNLINNMVHNSINQELSVEDRYFNKEENEILALAISHLPPQRQKIFKLCKIEGKSYAEVSEILSVSTSTVSNQLVSAMKDIKSFAVNHSQEIKLLLFFLFFSKK